MANFMGPMAPPQAAQPQPQALDVRTNPAQRAQFKSFMSSMSAPVMPTTAPVAPMLAAPSPMDQIDIFSPVQGMASSGFDQIRAFANGGFASGDRGRERGRGDFQGDDDFAGGAGFPSETSGDGGQGGKDDNEAALDAALDRIIDQVKNTDPDPVINLNQRLAETQLDPMGTLAQEVIPSTEIANMGSVMDNVPVQSGYGISPSGTGQDALADLLSGGVKSRAVDDGFTFDNLKDLFELQAMQAASAQDTKGTIAEGISDAGVDAFFAPRFLAPGMDGPTPAQLATQPIPDELSGQSPFTSGGVPSPLQQTMESYFDPSFMGEENLDATQTDLKSLFGEDSDTYKNIMERSTPFESGTFPTAAGILGKAMGGANINNIINKINEGGVPQLDAQGNIQGVVHDGFFGKVYSGNEAFNPFAGPKPEKDDGCPPGFVRVNGACTPISASTTPETEAPLTVAPPIVDPTPPVTPPSPTDVIVPSTRTDVPVTVPVVSPAPIGSILPQNLLDLLQARQPVRSFADGGAVLDDAAGRFLEALTAA